MTISPRVLARTLAPPAIALGVVALAMWPALPHIGAALRDVSPHAPDWSLWARQTEPVQMHVIAAVIALAIGCVILFLPKGKGLHKPLGWLWVAAMGATALSSLFITGLNGDAYSIIHLLTGWTLVALPMGAVAIRNRNVRAHQRAMLGLYLGGLLIAGALTFLPGRFLFEFLLG